MSSTSACASPESRSELCIRSMKVRIRRCSSSGSGSRVGSLRRSCWMAPKQSWVAPCTTSIGSPVPRGGSAPGNGKQLDLGAARVERLRQVDGDRAIPECVLPVRVVGGEVEVDDARPDRDLVGRAVVDLQRYARRGSLDDAGDLGSGGNLRQPRQLVGDLLLRDLALHGEDERAGPGHPLVVELADVDAARPQLERDGQRAAALHVLEHLLEGGEQVRKGGAEPGVLELRK